MQDDLERLSYRDLAERLGISADAARMKAKRKAKAGLWRIIPGNHPSDRVMIEAPASDLNKPERDGGEQRQRSDGERNGGTQGTEQANAFTAHLMASLTEAQERIRQLTDQLLEAKEANATIRVELAATEMLELGTKAELDRAHERIAEIERRLAEAQRPWWRRGRR